jgi:hypothetical protein
MCTPQKRSQIINDVVHLRPQMISYNSDHVSGPYRPDHKRHRDLEAYFRGESRGYVLRCRTWTYFDTHNAPNAEIHAHQTVSYGETELLDIYLQQFRLLCKKHLTEQYDLYFLHPRTKPKVHKCHGVTNGNVNKVQISFYVEKKLLNHRTTIILTCLCSSWKVVR